MDDGWIKNGGALLVCSDMYIIDEHGRTTAESITRVRRHHVFHSGSGLAPSPLVRNYVVGCTMLIRALAMAFPLSARIPGPHTDPHDY